MFPTSIFRKQRMGEAVLFVLLVLYLVSGVSLPPVAAGFLDTIVGKVVLFVGVLFLFMHSHPALGVLGALAAVDMVRKSYGWAANIAPMIQTTPTESQKLAQMEMLNPPSEVTLEEHMVATMTPSVQSDISILPASYEPVLDNTHDASAATDPFGLSLPVAMPSA